MSVNTLVLASGGVDSTACIHFYLSQGFNVSALFVDYGQPAAEQERIAFSKVTSYYNIDSRQITVSGKKTFSSGEIIGRNMFLLSTGLLFFEYKIGVIALGVHAGTVYKDCSPTFIASMQRLYDSYRDEIHLGTPFINLSKMEIWHYCKVNDIPLGLTYSCETGNVLPCGKCLSCLDIKHLSNKVYVGKN